MRRFRYLAVSSGFWKPNVDYVVKVVEALRGKVDDGDLVVVSEKAVSTATGNIVDEKAVKPGLTAYFLAKCWMRLVWAFILGPLCHLRKGTVDHFRKYPLKKGSVHKQVVLQYSGFLQALLPMSEGGIDGSNLPYSYVSLPLEDAHQIAQKILDGIRKDLGRSVTVMIVDSDKTYSWRNFHFTPRPRPMRGIRSMGGFITYVVGRALKLKSRATPLAVVGAAISVEEALEVANLSNRARGFGAGRTIWDMAKTFKVPLTAVTWEMLEKVKHKPIVIVRSKI